MSWSLKYTGNVQGIIRALDNGGGQYDSVSGQLIVPQTYTRACKEIVNHLTQQAQSPEIGWLVEAWGGDGVATLHIHIEPCNLRVAFGTPGRDEQPPE